MHLFFIFPELYSNNKTVLKEFRLKAATVTKTDFKTIEHLLRFGYKQKKLMEMKGFHGASVTGP